MPESSNNSDILLSVGIVNEDELHAKIAELQNGLSKLVAGAIELSNILKDAELTINDPETAS